MTQLINQLISNEGVFRTAPATPGLLITNKMGNVLFPLAQTSKILNYTVVIIMSHFRLEGREV